MTIAAGFVYRDGVLLCSDSQLTTYTSKTDARKLGYSSGPWGVSCVAIAGNGDFATTAAQRMRDELDKLAGPDGVMSTAERVLDRYYRKLVLSNPRHSTLPLDYSLLLTFRLPGQAAKLYVTQDTAIREITTYRCEGIGESLGHYLIRYLWRPDMSEEEIVSLAAYVIASAKNNVKDCGGKTFVGCLRSVDGSLADYSNEEHVRHIENIYGWYEQEARRFMISHCTVSDDEFKKQLATLTKSSLRIRRLWKELMKPPKRARRSTRKATKRDRPDQRPSQ